MTLTSTPNSSPTGSKPFTPTARAVPPREKEIGVSGGSVEPLGLFLRTSIPIYMAYSEHLLTRLNPLAERACFSQVPPRLAQRDSLGTVSAASCYSTGSSRGRVCH
jgi:hypothetical protein